MINLLLLFVCIALFSFLFLYFEVGPHYFSLIALVMVTGPVELETLDSMSGKL